MYVEGQGRPAADWDSSGTAATLDTKPPETASDGAAHGDEPRNLPTLSPEELDALLISTHAIANDTRLRFCRQLRAMNDSKFFNQLGFSSIAGYAAERFGFSASSTYEHLHVAERIDVLPEVRKRFTDGRLAWKLLHDISRVARPWTEHAWLAYLDERGVKPTFLELRHARENGRDRPRDRNGGLPLDRVRLTFELEPDDFQTVQNALAKVGLEMQEGLEKQPEDQDGGMRVEPSAALLYLSRRILETDADTPIAGDRKERGSAFTVLYHVCSACGKAALQTPDGAVAVDRERVARVEASAETVVITPEEAVPAEAGSLSATAPVTDTGSTTDTGPGFEPQPAPDIVPESERAPKNSPALVRKVTLKGGRRCANPFCGCARGQLHAHHVIWRCHGGATEVWNEILLCSRCHSLVHAKLLAIEGDAIHGVTFRPREPGTTARLDAIVKRLLETPEVRAVPVTVPIAVPARLPTDSPVPVAPRMSTGECAGGAEVEIGIEIDGGHVEALQRLGYDSSEARARVEAATKRVHAEQPEVIGTPKADEAILREALRSESARGERQGAD